MFFFFLWILFFSKSIQVHSRWLEFKLPLQWPFFLLQFRLFFRNFFVFLLLGSGKWSRTFLGQRFKMRMSGFGQCYWIYTALVEMEANECFWHLRALTHSSLIEVMSASSLWTFSFSHSSHHLTRCRACSTWKEPLICEIPCILAIDTSSSHSACLLAIVNISSTLL